MSNTCKEHLKRGSQNLAFAKKGFWCGFFLLVLLGCQLQGYQCLEDKHCEGRAICEQGWCKSYQCNNHLQCPDSALCFQKKCQKRTPLPPNAQPVRWTQLLHAKQTNGRISLESKKLTGLGFYAQGYASKGLQRNTGGQYLYVVTGGADHYYIGLSIGGSLYGFKVAEGELQTLSIDLRVTLGSKRTPYQEGDLLALNIEEKTGKLSASLNGKELELPFDINLQEGEWARPTFRLWPGHSRGIFLKKAFLVNGQSSPTQRTKVEWHTLQNVNKQNGKLVLNNQKPSDGKARRSGVGESKTPFSRKNGGVLSYKLSPGIHDHFVGFTLEGKYHAYKISKDKLYPHIDFAQVPNIAFTYAPGDILSFFVSEEGKFVSTLNERVLYTTSTIKEITEYRPYRLGLQPGDKPLYPKFIFYPGFVEDISFDDTFLLTLQSPKK